MLHLVNIQELSGLGIDEDATSLVVSASSWMDEAMRAWAAGDFAKVALMAPTAVEHLGKAVLWTKNPVLLVQLDPRDEASLMALATNPSLTGKTLRTVTLKLVLNRAERVMGGAPALPPNRKERMVNVRNGVTHVGTAELSRHVLLDALTVARAMLAHLAIQPSTFFGAQAGHVIDLLDAKRTETGHRVLAKRAKAQQRIAQLKEDLGEAEYLVAARRLEDQRSYLTQPDEMGVGLEAVDRDCPVCHSNARLFGHIELEEAVDYDVEPLGGGRYESIPMPYWEIWFTPQELKCAVCLLSLNGPEELAEVAIASERQPVGVDDLGDTFDLDEVVRDQYGSDYF